VSGGRILPFILAAQQRNAAFSPFEAVHQYLQRILGLPTINLLPPETRQPPNHKGNHFRMSSSRAQDHSPSAFASRSERAAKSAAHWLSKRPKYEGTIVEIKIKPKRDNEQDNFAASVTTEVQFPPSLSQRISGEELITTRQTIKDSVDVVWDALRADRPHGARELCRETISEFRGQMESRLENDPTIKPSRDTGIDFRVYGPFNFEAEKCCRCPEHIVDGSQLDREGTVIFTQVYGHGKSKCSSYFYRSTPDDYARMLSGSRIHPRLSKLAIRREQYKETLNHEIQKIVTEHAQNDQMSKLQRAEACSRDVEAMMGRDSVYDNLRHELLWPDTDEVYKKPDTEPIFRDNEKYFPTDFRRYL